MLLYQAGMSSVVTVCLFTRACLLTGGASQHHSADIIKKNNGLIGRSIGFSESGTSTPSGDGGSSSGSSSGGRSRSSSDDASGDPGHDGLERNVSTPNDALHLERRASRWKQIVFILNQGNKTKQKKKVGQQHTHTTRCCSHFHKSPHSFTLKKRNGL